MGIQTIKKTSKGKITVRAVAALIAVMEMIFISRILLYSQTKVTALAWNQNGGNLTVEWKNGGSGPWRVSVLWNGQALAEKEVDQREVAFQLAPGYDYTVRIGEECQSVSMEEMPNYPGGHISLENVKLCYYRIKENGKRGNDLIDAKPEVISLSSISEEGGRDYQISMFYEMYDGKETQALCFLLSNGFQESRSITFSPSDLPQFTDDIPLNDMLTAHSGGDKLLFKVYVDGYLLIQRSYIISTN